MSWKSYNKAHLLWWCYGSQVSVNSFSFFFWPYHATCGLLVPWLGIEPTPSALETWSLNIRTVREVPSVNSGPFTSWGCHIRELVPPWPGHCQPRAISLVYPSMPSLFHVYHDVWKDNKPCGITASHGAGKETGLRNIDCRRWQSWLGTDSMIQLCISDPDTDILSLIHWYFSTIDFSFFAEMFIVSFSKQLKTENNLFFKRWMVKQNMIYSYQRSTPVHFLSRVRLFATPWTAAHQVSLSIPTPGACSNSYPSSRWCHPTISSSVIPFSSCLQSFPVSGSFQWVSSLHHVAKVLDIQLQHQYFQWIFRTDFL